LMNEYKSPLRALRLCEITGFWIYSTGVCRRCEIWPCMPDRVV